MKLGSTVLVLGALVGGLAACGTVKETRLPDGGIRLVCEKGMKDCVIRAEKVCGDKGFTLISGGTTKRLLGGQSSSYRQLTEVAELELVCGAVELEPEAELPQCISLPAPAAAPPAAPSSACVPGASAQCIGPGGCQGGQACKADGSGFDACDCGGAASSPAPAAPPAPAAAAPAPAPAPVAPSKLAPQPTQAAPAVPGAAPKAEPLQ